MIAWVRKILAKRHIIPFNNYNFCSGIEESVDHLFASCHSLTPLWNLQEFKVLFPPQPLLRYGLNHPIGIKKIHKCNHKIQFSPLQYLKGMQ